MADNIQLDAMASGEIVKTDDVGGAHWQYVKVVYGADGVTTRVTDTEPLPVQEKPRQIDWKTYEDTSFLLAGGAVTLDFELDLGQKAISLSLLCDGPGAIGVEMSNDGVTFSDSASMNSTEGIIENDIGISKLRLTPVADSAYRIRIS